MQFPILVRRHPTAALAVGTALFILTIVIAGLYADRQVVDYAATQSSTQSLGTGSIRFPSALSQYDSGHYQSIITNGYTSTTAAFFPLYPLIAKALTYGGLSPAASLIVVSWACSVLAAIVIYRWIAFELQQRKIKMSPWIALGLIAAFPTSFFLTVGYGESLFLLLTMGSLYAYRRGWYLASGVLVGLATASRVQGGVLALFYLADIIIQKRHHEWQRYLPIVLAPIGIVAYMIFLGQQFGDPFAFIAAQRHWGRLDGNILQNLASSFTPLYLWYVPVLALMLTAVYRHLGKAWFILCAFSLLIPLASGRFDSVNRYMLALPPLFLALSLWLNNRPQWQRMAYIISSIFLLAWNIVFFFNGYWVA